MKPERWKQLDDLFHSALQLEPDERAAFLDEACAGDESLRKQVEALLAANGEAGSFIENPAFVFAAQALANKQHRPEANSIVGQSIGHYRILDALGAGGMGEVYLAQDLTLGRQVALKVLPAQLTEDDERLRRFEQEARAASALNHPNILTIYEIGHSESVHYIATEFIDGVTLRERMADKPVKTAEAIEVAVKVASALAAAHAKGIVHRDIKPENIMISQPGYLAQSESYVKVLDFGIAKLTEPDVRETDMPTRPLVSTSEGITIGTAPYMSPEQAQGLKVDARTDIWSLGVVLFEMVTGRAPFEGPTRSHLIVSILEKEPPPLRGQAEEVPEALEWIVSKTLRKNRDERYQTARELFSDLNDLRQRSDFKAKVERSKSAEQPTSAAHAPAAPVKLNTRSLWLVALVLITVTAVVLGLKYFGRNLLTSKSAAPFSRFTVTRLTSTGKASSAVISPDGKYVVHVMGSAEQHGLWLRHITTGSDQEIVPSNGSPISNLSFSPDGDHIYFIRRESGEVALSQVPVLGGNPKKLVTDIDTAVTISPDGKSLAFVRGDPPRNEASLIIVNADGTEEQKLVTHQMDDFFFRTACTPAWSPDGARIAFGLRGSGPGSAYRNVTIVQVKDRTEKQLTAEKWNAIEAIYWLPHGGGLVFTAIEKERRNAQIWYASYPAGELRRITNDLNNYQNVSLTTDGGSLVTVLSEGTSNIWISPVGDTGSASQITSSIFAGLSGIAWTPDGKVVYGSRASGNADIWIMNADGTADRQLTAHALLNVVPRVSPDGRYIVFMSNRAGAMNIWRMDIDGNNPKQLTQGSNDRLPLCTNDSKSVIFISDGPGNRSWKVPIDGGSPQQLTNYSVTGFDISPKDGRIVGSFLDEQAKPRRFRIGVTASDGGTPAEVFDFPEFFGTLGPGFFDQSIRWTADGHALTYIDTQGGVSNLWNQPVNGGPPKQVTNFKTDLIFFYAWSPDGKKLALARGHQLSDVVLIRDSIDQQ
jgi:eukaryotic-like serine/threonine-protein kinase